MYNCMCNNVVFKNTVNPNHICISCNLRRLEVETNKNFEVLILTHSDQNSSIIGRVSDISP